MTTLAIIPARSGSKGIPGKSFRDFCGHPLYEWATAIGRETCDSVCLTTDAWGATSAHAIVWKRSEELAKDDTPMLPVVQDVIPNFSRPDVVVLLQPTSPLRKPEHVREALRLLEETGADSVVSVTEIPAHYSPDYALTDFHDTLIPFCSVDEHGPAGIDKMATRRQDCRKAYSRDGTVYAIRRETIERGSLYGDKCVPLIIPPHESANIDTEEDWQRAEAIMKARLG